MKKNINLFNKIKNYIDIKINTILKNHNGFIKLIDIDENNNIIIKFYGKCKTCIVQINTYKNIITKKIKEKFPKINKIINLNT